MCWQACSSLRLTKDLNVRMSVGVICRVARFFLIFLKCDLLRLKFLQVHVGYTNCSDNQFTTVFLDAFHVGVVWYIHKSYSSEKEIQCKKHCSVKNTAGVARYVDKEFRGTWCSYLRVGELFDMRGAE